jgi:hypothetical protein
VRSSRARCRKAVTSASTASTARCTTSRAPRRPSAARPSPSPTPWLPWPSSPAVGAAGRALGAILSSGRRPPSAVAQTCRERLRLTRFRRYRDTTPGASMSPIPHRDLQNQKALVTGATFGIGRAIAVHLARAGAEVIVHGRDAARGATRGTAEIAAKVGNRPAADLGATAPFTPAVTSASTSRPSEGSSLLPKFARISADPRDAARPAASRVAGPRGDGLPATSLVRCPRYRVATVFSPLLSEGRVGWPAAAHSPGRRR